MEELEQRQEKQNSKNKTKKNNFSNYEQREYPEEFWNSLYENPPIISSEEDEMDLDM